MRVGTVVLTLLCSVCVGTSAAVPSAPKASDCRPNDTRGCDDATAHAQGAEQQTSPNDSKRSTTGADPKKTAESTDEDDDEETCVTRAANGICLDDED